MGDGAALEWIGLDPLLPNWVETLVFYHVMERVALIARSMHPAERTAAAWRKAIKRGLLEQLPKPLLKSRKLSGLEPASEVAREAKRVQIAYFERQQERMRYPQYRED